MRKCLAVLLLVLLCGCSGKTADISAYGDKPIEIAGLTEEEFTVTPNELAELERVSQSARGKTEKAGSVQADGPLLNTFLEPYGYQMSDFYKIRFICADGYKTVLRGEYLTDYDVILSISQGDEPLSEACRPLRLFIPGAESNMWAFLGP